MADFGFGSLFGNISGEAFMKTFYNVAIWILIVAILGVAFWFLYQMLIYQYRVLVLQRVGDHFRLFTLKARKINSAGDPNIKKFKIRGLLKGIKKVMRMPDADYFFPIGKNLGILMGYDGVGKFYPMKLSVASTPQFINADTNWEFWHSLQTRETHNLYDNKSFWDKYGMIVSWMIVMVLSFVLLIILFQRLENVSGAISSLASAVKGATTQTVVGAV